MQLTFNEKTKKNQDHKNSSAQNALHNEENIISAQPNNPLCTVKSLKKNLAKLNEDCNDFFQYPSKDNKGYDNKPIGKNSLADMMKDLSTDTELSRIYTNNCIHKTTATAMKRQGFDLNEIQNVTEHKNLDSLKHYISGPSYKDK